MNIDELKRNWHVLGKKDPMWAIITRSDKKGNKWEPEDFFKTGENKIAQLFEFLNDNGISVTADSAMDFGCGIGRLTQALASRFNYVAGVDIAESMIKLANEYNKHGDKCRYFLNTKDDLSLFHDKSFDFIYTIIVLQHMRPAYAKSYIKEFVRLLKPNGVCTFQVPSRFVGVTATPARPTFARRRYNDLLRLAMNNFKWLFKNRAYMEMYGIEKEEMIAYITGLGVKIANVSLDKSPGPQWESYQYTIIKS
jgi:ubiquinone/menaquinone biosynthesis C-methylase UbiE